MSIIVSVDDDDANDDARVDGVGGVNNIGADGSTCIDTRMDDDDDEEAADEDDSGAVVDVDVNG